jgi:hypothetical protein
LTCVDTLEIQAAALQNLCIEVLLCTITMLQCSAAAALLRQAEVTDDEKSSSEGARACWG